jgi:hypothetical protein
MRASEVVAEKRERARTEAWLKWEEQGCLPLHKDPDAEAAALATVDRSTRVATVSALTRLAREDNHHSEAPTQEEAREMYGAPRLRDDSIALNTDWEQGREPRRRVQLLHAAGWRRVPNHGGHPKWQRYLPRGAGKQVITFASTPSNTTYNFEKAALQRMDREARALLAQVDAGIQPGGV